MQLQTRVRYKKKKKIINDVRLAVPEITEIKIAGQNGRKKNAIEQNKNLEKNRHLMPPHVLVCVYGTYTKRNDRKI